MLNFNQLDNSLSKYSYPIFTFSNNVQYAATAFFYFENNDIYLVSNYHAIKGMSPMHSRLNWKSDLLHLKIYNIKAKKVEIINIDISEKTTGITQVFYMDSGIDLFKVKINIEEFHVNFINDLISPLYINSIPNRILIYGYPNSEGIQQVFWSNLAKFESQYNINGFDNFYYATMRNMPGFNKKERMYGLSKLYFFIDRMIPSGYSGAPIIGEFENEKNEITYHFIGVNFGNEPFSNQSWAIRGDVALEYLKN